MHLPGRTTMGFIVFVLLPLAGRAQVRDALSPVQRLWLGSFEAEKKEEYDTAITDVRKIMEITDDSTNTYANLRLGWLYYLKKDYRRAEAAYQIAATNAPSAVSPLYGLINCRVAAKKTDDAIDVAKRLLDIDPLNYKGNKTLGDLYYQNKDYESSGVYYYKLTAAHPEDLEIANSLAWCYLKMGRKDMAKKIFGNILAVLPYHQSANIGFQEAKRKAAAADNR